MIDQKIKKIVIFAALGTIVSFMAALLLFGPAPQTEEQQIWKVPVQSVQAMTPVPGSVLRSVLSLVPKPLMSVPDVSAFPYEEPDAPLASVPSPAVPQEHPENQVRLAIIIDDVGVVQSAARQVIALPSALTLSFLPYAPDVQQQVEDAQKAGHEIMLHMPMEPMAHINPGPEALLVALDDKETERRIYNNINAFTGYVGINNHMGSKYTSDTDKIRLFFDVLRKMNKTDVFFVDSKTTYKTVAEAEAQSAGYRTAMRDVFLDDKIEAQAIAGELTRLETIGRRKGYAIAIGHPHDLTIKALREWLPEVQKRGFTLVPVSQLVR